VDCNLISEHTLLVKGPLSSEIKAGDQITLVVQGVTAVKMLQENAQKLMLSFFEKGYYVQS